MIYMSKDTLERLYSALVEYDKTEGLKETLYTKNNDFLTELVYVFAKNHDVDVQQKLIHFITTKYEELDKQSIEEEEIDYGYND